MLKGTVSRPFPKTFVDAIKFTPKGGTILAEAQAGPQGFIQICVSDTGCGISAEELPRVFERFYRGESVAMEN